MKQLPYMGLGLGMTMDEAVVACRKALDGDELYSRLEFINLGFFYNEAIPADLPQLLNETGIPVTLHAVDINLSENIDERQLDQIAAKVEQLNIQWIVEDLGIWVWNSMYLGSHQLNPIQDGETAQKTIENIIRCKRQLACEILVENAPAYYIGGTLDIWDYLLTIAEGADCGIALDVGHMLGLLINSDRVPEFMPQNWAGWKRVTELHLSGYDILEMNGKQYCLDSHHLPFNQTLLWHAEDAVMKSPNLKSILLELEYAVHQTVVANHQMTIPLSRKLADRNARFVHNS